MKKYTCPCCGYKTFNRADSRWDICEVCFWQNDVIDPTTPSGANKGMTLAQAQQNFILFGACEKEFLRYTRLPLADEIKYENFKTFDETVQG